MRKRPASRHRRASALGLALPLALALAVPTAAAADFVHNNLRHILYHEVGHAVIDQMVVPIFGPEETAADGFAVMLAGLLHDEAELRDLLADVVALARTETERELFDPWHDYMPGAQRLAWAICVYYGLDPRSRGDHARALGMPNARAGACEEAGRRVRAAWAPILARMRRSSDAGPSLRATRRGKALRVIAADIAAVNAIIALPRPVPVDVESCGEDNAYYYHGAERIAFCEELMPAIDAARP